jgi:hypothetical protein
MMARPSSLVILVYSILPHVMAYDPLVSMVFILGAGHLAPILSLIGVPVSQQ